MPSKPETRLQKKIADRLRDRGAWVGKIHGNIYSAGIPDLLGCYRGRFFALEVKTPENKKGATELQEAQLRRIREAGGLGYVIRSVDAADSLIDKIDKQEAEDG
jgi:Holliday junction resolvase